MNIVPMFYKRNGRIYFNMYLRHRPILGKKPICLNNILIGVVFYISFLIGCRIMIAIYKPKCEVVIQTNNLPIAKPVPTPTKVSSKSWKGKVSYYSKDGCLGCGVNQITASGEKFDETKMTLAFNKLPMKTMVLVTNLDTGVSMVAKVNDRGGFEKYNRIADLSKALFNALGAKTDITNIKIEEIK